MARIPMTSGFMLIPEGTYIFRIYDASYDEEFGKIEIKMVNAKGMTHTEKFSIKDSNDEMNEKALNAFSFFAKTAMNDFSMEDVDPDDLIGHYIEATVVHTELPSNKDPNKTVKFANLDREKYPADGFDEEPVERAMTLGRGGAVKSSTTTKKAPQRAAQSVTGASQAKKLDLDDLLGDD